MARRRCSGGSVRRRACAPSVQRRIGIGAAHRLVQRRDLVVELSPPLSKRRSVAGSVARRKSASTAAHCCCRAVASRISSVLSRRRVASPVRPACRAPAIDLHVGRCACLPRSSSSPVRQAPAAAARRRRRRQQRRRPLERRVSVVGRRRRTAPTRLRQEGVLLRLVEAVDSSTNTSVAAPAAREPAPLDRLADVLHAAQHRRDAMNSRPKASAIQPRQRRLARPRRPPEDHRVRPADSKATRSGLRGRAGAPGRSPRRAGAAAAARPARGRVVFRRQVGGHRRRRRRASEADEASTRPAAPAPDARQARPYRRPVFGCRRS